MPPRISRHFLVILTLVLFSNFTPLHAQSKSAQALKAITPQDRIVVSVDEGERVVLGGNTLAQALPVLDRGGVDGDQRLDRMLLTLTLDRKQQASLDALTEAQQDARSPLYHQWLTPEEYAEHFGVSNSDLEQVESWLQRYGLQVDEVASSRQSVIFSGTANQVEAAFQIELRNYTVSGHKHMANASDPSIPGALAAVVGGVVSLHDFFAVPQHNASRLSPQYSSGATHYLSPADFATIYDVTSLYHQAYTGSGETIAIVGRSDISLSDIRGFRNKFALTPKDPVITVNGIDPGSLSSSDFDESTLDVEWSGAVAPGANIEFVTSASTATTDGIFLSSQYVVDHNLASILSVSYGLCESSLGASGNHFFNALWEQAAAQGITVVVAAGDSGAAGCDAPSENRATQGPGVNGLCSTPYSTCIGGTEFSDQSNPGLYWANANGPGDGTALSYIPEVAWNESSASGLWSGGGGISLVYAKPSWQAAPGVLADGRRDVPDVALAAAGHDGYLVEAGGILYAFSGTSAATPSFAGVLALVAQKARVRLGSVNTRLYGLASTQLEGASGVFHDVVSGNNSVSGVTGYNAGAGFDRVTGLGSVDAEKLVDAWTNDSVTAPTNLSVSATPQSSFLARGGMLFVNVSVTSTGIFNAPVQLAATSLPSGVTARFLPAMLPAPGAGAVSLVLTATKAATMGAFQPTVTANEGSLTASGSFSSTITAAGVPVIAQPVRRFRN